MWFRVPVSLAKNLDGSRKATTDEATVDLLGRWHLGENPSIYILRRAWRWSADRVIALRRKLGAWARAVGAYVPFLSESIDFGREDDGCTSISGERPDASRARVPSSERERTDVVHAAPAPLERMMVEPDNDEPSIPEPASEEESMKPKPEVQEGMNRVWDAYRRYHPKAKAEPPKAVLPLLRSAVEEYGADDVVAVVAWAHLSTHKRAAYLRENQYLGADNLLRREKMQARVEWATEWTATPEGRVAMGALGQPAVTAAQEAQLPADPLEARFVTFVRDFAARGNVSSPPVWRDHPDRMRAEMVAGMLYEPGVGGWVGYYSDPAGTEERLLAAFRAMRAEAANRHQEARGDSGRSEARYENRSSPVVAQAGRNVGGRS